MLHSNKFHMYGSFLVFSVLCYFSLFHQLGEHPMNNWDEPSYSLNAQEMLERGNPIEVHLLGQPDLYNSKPPFAIWCMAICIKVFGFNELGVRMASAIFGLLSALVLWLVGIKIVRNYWTALTLPLVLLSSYGFVGWHIARTGDTDSVLAFWILFQSVLILGYTNSISAKNSNRYLFFAGLAISLGCLTKGIAGLTALPGIVAWLIYSRKFKETLLKKEFYIAILSFLVIVIGYYWLRNKQTPGYFNAVLENEIISRLKRQDFLNHRVLPFYYYFENMLILDRFQSWIWVLPVSIIYIFTRPACNLKNTGIFFIFIFLSISILLTLSQTKLLWYDAPLYPLMAAIIGISFCLFFNQQNSKYVLVLFIYIFSWPYYRIVLNNSTFNEAPSLGSFLKKIRQNGGERNEIHVVMNPEYNYLVYFYVKQDCLNGYYSDVVGLPNNSLAIGNYVVVENAVKDSELNQAYVLRNIRRSNEQAYYQIMEKK